MEKTFALYIFHPNRQGWERYEFKYNIQIKRNIPDWMRLQFAERYEEFQTVVKIVHLDSKVNINDVWFNDMWIACTDMVDQELVIAERIPR